MALFGLLSEDVSMFLQGSFPFCLIFSHCLFQKQMQQFPMFSGVLEELASHFNRHSWILVMKNSLGHLRKCLNTLAYTLLLSLTLIHFSPVKSAPSSWFQSLQGECYLLCVCLGQCQKLQRLTILCGS